MSLSSRTRGPIKYVYDLPYTERMELCKILDQNDKWEILGGQYMNLDMLTIQQLRREVLGGRSPTDELLTLWGHQNHTILELYVHLSQMHHYQAMLVIKTFVDPEYHRLLYEGEANLSRLCRRVNPHHEDATRGDKRQLSMVNYNQSDSSNVLPAKMDGLHQNGCESEKIVNGEANTNSNGATLPVEVNNVNLPAPSNKDASNISIGVEAVGPPMIPFKELEMATGGWDPGAILGKGGFATVYKGLWKNTPVAIKRTRKNDTHENHTVPIQQILGELKLLSTCRHDNILPLYGYSVGGEDPCLIYQFMPHGSLEDRLLCRSGTAPLTWEQRLAVAVGIARGLQFLHTINETPLIHGDIKSANILLDSNYRPKIGDFGLAREGPQSQFTHMKVSRVHGTRPYLPDEFLRAKKFSTKVDTHCFGIVLFELVTGLRAYDDQRNHKFLRDLVENSTDAQLLALADKKAGSEEPGTFTSLLELGKCCVKRKPKERPEMVIVLRDLELIEQHREQVLRAHHLVKRNSLIPSNPYEKQLLHDHLSQQRNINMSPLPPKTFSAATTVRYENQAMYDQHNYNVSPIPPSTTPSPYEIQMMYDQRMSPLPSPPYYPNSRNVSPLPQPSSSYRSGFPLNNNGTFTRNISPQPPRSISPNFVRNISPQPASALDRHQVSSIPENRATPCQQNGGGTIYSDTNPFKSTYRPPSYNNPPSEVMLPATLRVTASPSISVSPPSRTHSDFSEVDEAVEEDSQRNLPQSTPDQDIAGPPPQDSEYSCILPLISELGIKKKEGESTSRREDSSGPLSESTAKGKTLWILGESG